MNQLGIPLYLVILFGVAALLLIGLEKLEALLRRIWPKAVGWLLSGWHLAHVCAAIAFAVGCWISLSGEAMPLQGTLRLAFPLVLVALVYAAPVVAALCAMLFVNPVAVIELVAQSVKRLCQYVFRLR